MKYSKTIVALQKQNPKVQKEVYQTYSPLFMSLCMRYVKDETLAEDVIIKGFTKIFSEVKKFETRGNLKAWMYKIMVNECLMELRKNHNFLVRIEPHTPISSPENNALDYLYEQDLMAIIQQLPIGCRTVFNLFIIEGYSHKEIAYKLQITEGTSKSQLNLAKTKLKKILTTQFKDQENGR